MDIALTSTWDNPDDFVVTLGSPGHSFLVTFILFTMTRLYLRGAKGM